MTKIYDDLSESDKKSSGYFETKAPFQPIESNIGSYLIYSKNGKGIDKNTLVLYYPGSFGLFHDGHMSVLESAWKKYRGRADNVVVVISPANSDYLADKYGASTTYASNKDRYKRIKAKINDIQGDDVHIDLNPMLNFTCDHNFTDLLENYLNCYSLSISEMIHKPVILCGKDRTDFAKLNDLQNQIEVYHHNLTVPASTSATIASWKNTVMHNVANPPKSPLFLRIHQQWEYDLFKQYFGDEYESIEPIFILHEINIAKNLAKVNDIRYTICKDYAGFLIYKPLSRGWLNPLEQSENWDSGFDTVEHLYEEKVLDSDVFTGSTRNYLKSIKSTLIAVYDFTQRNYNPYKNVELLDFDDFRKSDWCYPHVDISSRCSMSAFTHETHIKFKQFLEEVKSKS